MDKDKGKFKPRYVDQEERQPSEWEALLEDVTVPPGRREIPFDPAMIPKVWEMEGEFAWDEGLSDAFTEDAMRRQIEEIRRVAERKLEGVQRKSLLLLLATGMTYRRIAAALKVSNDTVERAVKKGTEAVREHFGPKTPGPFPTRKGTRPVIRAAAFPLDTAEEKTAFQEFVNQHVVAHLAYSSEGRFREALVLYLTGKAAGNATRH